MSDDENRKYKLSTLIQSFFICLWYDNIEEKVMKKLAMNKLFVVALTITVLLCVLVLPSTAHAGEHEKRVVAECTLATKGEPKATAACIASRLTKTEIDKCLKGDCFGKNNTLRKMLDDIVNPGENHDVFGRKGWLRSRLGI